MTTYRSFLKIEASAVYSGDAPTLEILVDGVVIGSALVTASTGTGMNMFSYVLEWDDAITPDSLSFRFNDGSAESGRSISLETIRINGQAVSESNLTSTLLSQYETSSLNTSSTAHLFGRSEPTVDDLNNPVQADGGRLTGNDENNEIAGSDVDDKIFALNGHNIILGGDGDDTLIGGTGDDALFGGTGNDRLSGNAGNNLLNGGAGDDRIIGGSGDDIIYGGAGNDVLLGTAGNNYIYGDSGNNRIIGGTGNDTLIGGTGDDLIAGRSGQNTIYGTGGNNRIKGGSDDDTIYGGTGNDTIYGGTGDDVIEGTGGQNIINGEDGNDTITASDNGDTLSGGAGNDILQGGAGNDLIYGHSLDSLGFSAIMRGNSGVSFNPETNSFYQYVSSAVNFSTASDAATSATINGVAGHLVTITSQAENDFVQNLAGGNQVWLGISDSLIEGEWRWTNGPEAGSQLWAGDENGSAVYNFYNNWQSGEPNDWDNGDPGEDHAVMAAGGQWNDLNGSANSRGYIIEWSGVDFGSSSSYSNTLYGGGGDDLLYAGHGGDTLYGESGNNQLFGGNGDDMIYGGTGSDYIAGGGGNNVIYAGTGSHIIYGANPGPESITPEPATDTIADIDLGLVSSFQNKQNATVDFSISFDGGSSYEDFSVTFEQKNNANATSNNLINAINNLGDARIDAVNSGGSSITFTASPDGDYGPLIQDILYNSSSQTDTDILSGIATQGQDAITGSDFGNVADGDNMIYGGSGDNDIYGGTGQDTFAYESDNAFGTADNIYRFNTGDNDALDISDILFDAGYDPLADTLTDFVQITDNGTDSTLRVDITGTASFGSGTELATLIDVTGLTDESALVASGNLIVS